MLLPSKSNKNPSKRLLKLLKRHIRPLKRKEKLKKLNK
jgi:hypothetical protein